MDSKTFNSLVILNPEFLNPVYGDQGLRRIQRLTNLLTSPLDPERARGEDALLEEAEVVFSSWYPPLFNAQFLDKAPKLKAVFYAAGEIHEFLTDEVPARGIRVFTAKSLNSEAVANYSLAVILFSLKGGFAHSIAAREGSFNGRLVARGIHQAKIGLISLGSIGRKVANLLKTFNVNIVGYDPFVDKQGNELEGVDLVDNLDRLFSDCDVVSLHSPLNDSTRGLIRGKHLRLMKKNASFINTARGAIVNEAEMLEVLLERPDIMVILDVTDPEPPVQGSPLYALPNVILTPHVSGAIGSERRLLGEAMIDAFECWRRGIPTKYEIT